MSTIGTPPPHITTEISSASGAIGTSEQLSLLDVSATVPLQFRLNERTRLAGLAHVAALRAQLAEQAAARRGVASERRSSRQIAA